MPQPSITTSPVSMRAAVAARITIASTVLFALLLGSLHLLEPEFDPRWRFISEYALGRYGWLMVLAFLSMATSIAAIFMAVRSQVRTVVGYFGLTLLLVSATGILIAAVFRTDPMGAGGAATVDGRLHDLGASLDLTPLAALMISFSLARNAAWREIRMRLNVTAGITLLTTAAFLMSMAILPPAHGTFGPGTITGLLGRILVLSYSPWLIATALHVLALSKRTGSTASALGEAA
jgi:Protein of unknown function (DUF998)